MMITVAVTNHADDVKMNVMIIVLMLRMTKISMKTMISMITRMIKIQLAKNDKNIYENNNINDDKNDKDTAGQIQSFPHFSI